MQANSCCSKSASADQVTFGMISNLVACSVLAFGTLSKSILSQWLRATLSRMSHALVKLDHVNGVGWRPLKAMSCILCECDVVPSCILCECDVVTCMLGLWRLRTCTSVDQNARVALLIKTLVFWSFVGRIRACGCVSATMDVFKELVSVQGIVSYKVLPMWMRV